MTIPAVVGMRDVTSRVRSGDPIILDGHEGVVIVRPDPATLGKYRQEQERRAEAEKLLLKLKDLPAQTTDGHRLTLAANIETSEDVKTAVALGAEGIGLFRTEFLFLNRRSSPTEEEHFENYKRSVRAAFPHVVVLEPGSGKGEGRLSPLQG
jgi:phosphotransferase system enzyme I (PtsI)